MYSLLLKADLVIADITTMNENAIYELGIRHALKPFSTIIMMQESEKIPFDLNHCRILTYKDFGEVLDDEEAEKIKTNLHSFIKASEEQNIDSPLYTYLPNPDKPEKLFLFSTPCVILKKKGVFICYSLINTLIKFMASLPVMTA